MRTKWFKGVANKEDLKREFRNLSKKYHPDVNKEANSTKIYIEIKDEFEYLYNRLPNESPKNENNNQDKKEYEDFSTSEFFDIISKLVKYDDINVEIVGTWIWLSGNTYPIKEVIKELGFKWSKSNKKWFKSPTEFDKKRRTAKTWEWKVETFGCKTVGKGQEKIKLK